MLKGNFKIVDSNQKITNNFYKEASKELRKIFEAASPKIQADVINIVVDALMDCPEVKALQGGSLKYAFGIPDSEVVTTIVYAIANSTKVKFKNFKFTKSTVSNVLSVYIQPTDMKNILGLEEAYIETEMGAELPWLQWLLLRGDEVIVYDFHVLYRDGAGRSGGAIMVPKGVYKVESQYSGTIEDNFITRAITKEIGKIVEAVGRNI